MNRVEEKLAALKAKHRDEIGKLDAELQEQEQQEKSDGRFREPISYVMQLLNNR